MVLYWLRLICAGELFGGWGKFGDIGAQLHLPSTRIEACIENNVKGVARLADAECHPLALMDRSWVDTQEEGQIIMDPDCDRRLRVIDEQERSHHLRQPRAGNARNKRSNPPPSRGSSEDTFRYRAFENARERRYRKDRPLRPRT